MKRTFEEFLKDWHMRDYMGTDDDAPDAFDNWMGEIEQDRLIDLADLFGREMELRGYKQAADTALEVITKFNSSL